MDNKGLKKVVTEKSDTSLVDAAIKGDADAFEELCRRYYSAMVAIGHSILGDRDLAEDAAQQAFAKAAINLPQLKSRDQFAKWLAIICRNAARDMAQKMKKTPRIEDMPMANAEPHQEQTMETTEIVREALCKLSGSAREVIFLRFYDGLSYEQISAVLGISEQAINGRLRRAKKKMAYYLCKSDFYEVQI